MNQEKAQRIAIKHNHDCPVSLEREGMKGYKVIGNTHLVWGLFNLGDMGFKKKNFFWWVGMRLTLKTKL